MATGSFQTEAGAIDVSLEAGEDLSAKQYYAVKRDATTGLIVVAGANEKALGILQNKPTAGLVAQVRISGVSLAKLTEGGTIAFGKYLTPISGGALEICDAADEEYCAQLLGANATGDLVEVLLCKGKCSASDA